MSSCAMFVSRWLMMITILPALTWTWYIPYDPVEEDDLTDADFDCAKSLILPRFSMFANLSPLPQVESPVIYCGAKQNCQKFWPHGEVPYAVSILFNATERCAIARAIDEFHRKTCIRFVPRRGAVDYVMLRPNGDGCESYIGRKGEIQITSLDKECFGSSWGTVMHELMHSLGFPHEQARADRDKYVIINWDNIERSKRYNYNKSDDDFISTLTPYDYSSIMHYGIREFSIDGFSETMMLLEKDAWKQWQRDALSKYDLEKLGKVYCSPAPSTIAPSTVPTTTQKTTVETTTPFIFLKSTTAANFVSRVSSFVFMTTLTFAVFLLAYYGIARYLKRRRFDDELPIVNDDL